MTESVDFSIYYECPVCDDDAFAVFYKEGMNTGKPSKQSKLDN